MAGRLYAAPRIVATAPLVPESTAGLSRAQVERGSRAGSTKRGSAATSCAPYRCAPGLHEVVVGDRDVEPRVDAVAVAEHVVGDHEALAVDRHAGVRPPAEQDADAAGGERVVRDDEVVHLVVELQRRAARAGEDVVLDRPARASGGRRGVEDPGVVVAGDVAADRDVLGAERLDDVGVRAAPGRTWMWSKVLPSISTPVPSIWIASPVRRSKWLPRIVRLCVPVIDAHAARLARVDGARVGPSWKWLPSKRMSREPRMFTAFVRSLPTNSMWSLPK